MHTGHTPGPWHIGINPGPIIYNEQGDQVANMCDGLYGDAENRANACLIAAAPSMFDALNELVTEWDRMQQEAQEEPGCFGINETVGQLWAREALVKARGDA